MRPKVDRDDDDDDDDDGDDDCDDDNACEAGDDDDNEGGLDLMMRQKPSQAVCIVPLTVILKIFIW